MKPTVRITVDDAPTKHEDGNFFAMSIAGGGVDASVPIDATAGGRFVAMRRAESVLIVNGITPDRFDLDVPQEQRHLFPCFDFADAEPAPEMGH